MKKCPACAEEIQDEAIKCRYCGERLDAVPKYATFVEARAQGTQAFLLSDANKRGLFELIVAAIDGSRYMLLGADPETGLIRLETRGMTMNSWSGEQTVISIRDAENGGAVASLSSKGKPSGIMRLSYGTSASKVTRELVPIMQQLIAHRNAQQERTK